MATLNNFIAPAVKTSNFDLSTTRTFSATPGVLIPFYHRHTFPGDKFFIEANYGIETLPLQSPMLSSYRARVAWFWLSWRALCPRLHLGSANIDPRNINLPYYQPVSTPFDDSDGSDFNVSRVLALADSSDTLVSVFLQDSRRVSPGSLLSYLYVPGDTFLVDGYGDGTQTQANPSQTYIDMFRFNGAPFFMYWSVFYHYYANWQEASFYYIEGSYKNYQAIATSTNTGVLVNGFYGTDSLDALNSWLLSVQTTLDPGRIGEIPGGASEYPNPISEPQYWIPFGGMALVTHRPDFFNARISVASRQNIRTSTSIDASSGTILLDDLIGSLHLKKYLELGFLSAASYRDWIYAQFGVTPREDVSTPQYLGSTTWEQSFNTVVATSAEGLGDLGGRGSGGAYQPLRRYNFQEYGTLMAFFTLTPIVSYTRVLWPEDQRTTLAEYPTPAMQNIAWQPILLGTGATGYYYYHTDTSALSSLDYSGYLTFTTGTATAPNAVLGYQPAWSEAMTDVPITYGTLSDTLDFWMLNRSYSPMYAVPTALNNGSSTATHFLTSTYVFPHLYNTPFVDSSPYAENFLVQAKLNIRARRALSKSPIPTI